MKDIFQSRLKDSLGLQLKEMRWVSQRCMIKEE